jgi:hypothetical protein
MQYDMICTKCKAKYWITCTLANKPKTCRELGEGIVEARIFFQENEPFRGLAMERVRNCDGELETDFTTQKPIRHNINWITVENL